MILKIFMIDLAFLKIKHWWVKFFMTEYPIRERVARTKL